MCVQSGKDSSPKGFMPLYSVAVSLWMYVHNSQEMMLQIGAGLQLGIWDFIRTMLLIGCGLTK